MADQDYMADTFIRINPDGTVDVVVNGVIQATSLLLSELLVVTPEGANEVSWLDDTGHLWQAIRGYFVSTNPAFARSTLELAVYQRSTNAGLDTVMYDSAGVQLTRKSLLKWSGGVLSNKLDSDFALKGAMLNATPADPAAITNAAERMEGLGGTLQLTPQAGGEPNVACWVVGNGAGGGANCVYRLRFGTGVPPANGAVPSGTLIGAQQVSSGAPLTLLGVANGLVQGTTYWFDVTVQGNGAAAANAKNLSVLLLELPAA